MIDWEHLSIREERIKSVIERYSYDWISCNRLAKLANVPVGEMAQFLRMLHWHDKIERKERDKHSRLSLWKVKL